MPEPIFYLLAGPNGAGKSSLYRAVVKDGIIPAAAEFVNADLHERDHLHHLRDAQARSAAARDWADARRATLLIRGRTFVSETVFSHESKLQLIADAQQHGFMVVLLVVCLDDAQRLLARVAQRVREGGHDVPADRVLARYPRTLAHLRRAVRMADMALLYDNGGAPDAQHINTLKRVAVCRKGATRTLTPTLPQWAQTVLHNPELL